MRTSTPLVYVGASPPSVRKSTSKRRRLNYATDPGRALTDNSNVGPTPSSSFSMSLCAKLSCSTCHRILSTAIRPGVAGPSLCSRCVLSHSSCMARGPEPPSHAGVGAHPQSEHSADLCHAYRCSAPTCTICARTCTSYTRPLSFPPTPALTRSPSPAAHPHFATPISPKRVALGFSHAAMNCDAALPPSSTKRKKAPTENDHGDGDLDGSAGRDHYNVHVTHGYGTDSVVLPGCGRIVCRACCVESVFK
ncbi:hypothetical protein JVU11DRAFT_7064 [Chiua virens]|nr:hypothetical protein JVU11DRAFT_7064 [Chiua virens]